MPLSRTSFHLEGVGEWRDPKGGSSGFSAGPSCGSHPSCYSHPLPVMGGSAEAEVTADVADLREIDSGQHDLALRPSSYVS